MAKEIIHISPKPEKRAEFDVEQAIELARTYTQENDWLDWHLELQSQITGKLNPTDNDDGPMVLIQDEAFLSSANSRHSYALLPHVDGVGRTLIGSSRLPTRLYTGVVPIPRGLEENYYEKFGPEHPGGNDGVMFFETTEGSALVQEALVRGDLAPYPHLAGTITLLGETTIHSSQADDPSYEDFGEPRLLVQGFDYKD